MGKHMAAYPQPGDANYFNVITRAEFLKCGTHKGGAGGVAAMANDPRPRAICFGLVCLPDIPWSLHSVKFWLQPCLSTLCIFICAKFRY
jgi:hypothetical protein